MLTGILVRFEAGKLVMVATDSYRLSVKETELGESAPELEAIIPARALTELSRLAGGDTVELGVHENHVVFGTSVGDTADAWLTTRRIDGQFPNYRQLLPETFEVELTLPKSELADVVRRASVLALRNSPLRLRLAEGELTVSAQTQDVGETQETMPAAYSGEEFVIGFNAEFLRDGVDSIAGDDVRVKLINPLRPAILEDAAGDFTYLIMPIRLARDQRPDRSRRHAPELPQLRTARARAPPGLVLVTGANGAGRRTCSSHCTSARRGSRRGRGRSAARPDRGRRRPGRARRRAGRAAARARGDAAAGGKRAKLNGAPLRSAEQLRTEVATLVFTPDRLAVVKGGPAARRAYFDRTLGRLQPGRAALPVEYAAAVGQRNAALRRVQVGASTREAVAPGPSRSRRSGHSWSRTGGRRSRC